VRPGVMGVLKDDDIGVSTQGKTSQYRLWRKSNKSGEAARHQKHATHPYHWLVHLPPSARRP
jgi:hypothetical protein